MPIYEYRCNACGRRLSLFQRRISAEPSLVCPHCRSADLQRLISSFAVVRSAGNIDDSGDFDPTDTSALLRDAHHFGEQMGVDLGSEFDDDINAMTSGESDFGSDSGDWDA